MRISDTFRATPQSWLAPLPFHCVFSVTGYQITRLKVANESYWKLRLRMSYFVRRMGFKTAKSGQSLRVSRFCRGFPFKKYEQIWEKIWKVKLIANRRSRADAFGLIAPPKTRLFSRLEKIRESRNIKTHKSQNVNTSSLFRCISWSIMTYMYVIWYMYWYWFIEYDLLLHAMSNVFLDHQVAISGHKGGVY